MLSAKLVEVNLKTVAVLVVDEDVDDSAIELLDDKAALLDDELAAMELGVLLDELGI